MSGAVVGARVAAVVVGALVLAGLAAVGTNDRQLVGFAEVDGRVVQVTVRCTSMLEGGSVAEVGDPLDVDVPQDDGLEVSPGVACPEDGTTWRLVLGVLAILTFGAVGWAWTAAGERWGAQTS